MSVGYIAKKAAYLHSLAGENKRGDEKMQILQVRFK
jgi:hypothetical protein